MKQLLLPRIKKNRKLKSMLLCFALMFSMQSFADETNCGYISGFEFSNGNSSVSITDEGSYSLTELPNDFYVDVIVSGYSESASIKIKNLDTGQSITVGENYLPYTNPPGNGAWSYGTGTFEVDAKIFKYNYCEGSYCDREKIEFTITNTSSCGQIDDLEFSNGTDAVTIQDGGNYNIADLPFNFYVDVIVSGMTESAFNRITNLDTGAVYTNGENVLPYTYPSGNQAWNLGTGTFQFYSEIFKYDNCLGSKCDYIYVTFTLYEDNCGEIASLEFSNGTNVIALEDGGTYNINALPTNFYIDAIVAGQSESLRYEVENLDTGDTYMIIENYLPYTFPAGNGAWFLGAGTFEVKAMLYSGNYCNYQLCDEITVTFTINEENCGSITGLEFSNFSSEPTVALEDGGSYDINTIPSNFNINVLTSGNIESAFNTLTNLDTGEVYTKLENVVPYTFPGATYQVWTLGCGTFEFCASVYDENYANGQECDTICVTFTLTGCDPDDPIACEDTFAGTGTIESDTVFIGQTGVETLTVIPNGDAVLPEGVTLGLMVTQGPDLIIRALSNTTDVQISFFGNFKVHLFAYDESTLDLSSVVFGQTLASDILAIIATSDLCASLEPLGIPFVALPEGVAKDTVSDVKEDTDTTEGEAAEEDTNSLETTKLDTAISKVDIKLYPNPVSDHLNIEILLLDAEVMNYNIRDLNGRQVLSGSFDNSTLGKTKVNTGNISNGLYIVVFDSNFRSFSKKIQVNH